MTRKQTLTLAALLDVGLIVLISLKLAGSIGWGAFCSGLFVASWVGYYLMKRNSVI